MVIGSKLVLLEIVTLVEYSIVDGYTGVELGVEKSAVFSSFPLNISLSMSLVTSVEPTVEKSWPFGNILTLFDKSIVDGKTVVSFKIFSRFLAVTGFSDLSELTFI